MTEESSKNDGAFARMLADEDGIRRFMDEVVQPLRKKAANPVPTWRLGFRSSLPFYRLLDERQGLHLRSIFRHALPDRDIGVELFEQEERIELDLLAEKYVSQAQIFADLMGEYQYEVAPQTRRDVSGRIIGLTLSGSVFFLDTPGDGLERSYRYSNIYGNRDVEPAGKCLLKGHPRVGHCLRTNQFRSSPLLLIAVHPGDAADEQDLAELSGMVRVALSTRVEELSRVSRVELFRPEGPPPEEEAARDDSSGDAKGDRDNRDSAAADEADLGDEAPWRGYETGVWVLDDIQEPAEESPSPDKDSPSDSELEE
jgi:hypothetical protein